MFRSPNFTLKDKGKQPRCIPPQLALRRIAARVKQGGHNIPRDVVIRRFHRGFKNFEAVYQPLADVWAVYDNSGEMPIRLEYGP